MTLEQIKKALEDRNLTLVANKIGIHVNTLYNIRDGKSQPNHHTFIKLQSYLRG